MEVTDIDGTTVTVQEGEWFTLNGVRYKFVSESEDILTLRDRLGVFEIPIKDQEYS